MGWLLLAPFAMFALQVWSINSLYVALAVRWDWLFAPHTRQVLLVVLLCSERVAWLALAIALDRSLLALPAWGAAVLRTDRGPTARWSSWLPGATAAAVVMLVLPLIPRRWCGPPVADAVRLAVALLLVASAAANLAAARRMHSWQRLATDSCSGSVSESRLRPQGLARAILLAIGAWWGYTLVSPYGSAVVSEVITGGPIHVVASLVAALGVLGWLGSYAYVRRSLRGLADA